MDNYKNSKQNIFIFLMLVFSIQLFSQSNEEVEKKEQEIKPEVKIGGRIHYDFEFLSQKNGISASEDYYFAGQEFRSVYITAIGSLTKNIKFKLELDFAGGKMGYRDMYIKFVDIPLIGGNVILGSQAEPSGLELLSGGNYVLFKEKTPLTATQNYRWNSGFGYENFNLLNKKLGLQMTYAFNGKNTEGFTDTTLENGAHFVARLTSPIIENTEKKQLVHVGVNFENRKYTKEPTNYTLRFRPENHMGYQVSIPFINLKKQIDYGFELAANSGPFSVQSEYALSGYQTTTKNYQIKSYYAVVSYFLTGENRKYNEGVFGRVYPYDNLDFDNKTYGAFELLLRFSEINYEQVMTEGKDDRVKSIAFGLNWYFNSHARLMYNYILSDFNKSVDNNKLNQHLFRVQVDF